VSPLVDEQVRDQIKGLWERLVDRAQADGFILPVRPEREDLQVLPTMITEICSEDLGIRRAALLEWVAYAGTRVTFAEMRLATVRLAIKHQRASLGESSKDKWKRDDAAATNPIFQELERRELEADSYLHLARELHESLKQRFDLLSREQSRRSDEMDRRRRV